MDDEAIAELSVEQIRERLDEIDEEIAEIQLGEIVRFAVEEGLVEVEEVDGEYHFFPGEDAEILEGYENEGSADITGDDNHLGSR